MNRFFKIVVWTLLLATPLVVDMRAQEIDQPVKRSADDVMIGADDTLDIVAINCKEITGTWRVGTSGDLNLQMVGNIHAAGKTPKELEKEIAAKLQKYLHEPQVTIHLAELRSQPVTVSGYVEKPGVYQIAGQKTLFELLLLAGGTKPGTQTVTVRRSSERPPFDIADVKEYSDGGYSSIDLDLTQVMSARGEQGTLEILPRDVIWVAPPRAPRYVQIIGEVHRPGLVELVNHDTISLLQVIATAGGISPLAKQDKTYIWHINEDGVRSEEFVTIDLELIIKGEKRDLLLTAGDIVVVERSTAKALAQTATTSAFSAGISAAILVLTRY